MKKRLLLYAATLAVLAIPQRSKAQSFSYTYEGQTLNYSVNYGNAEVTGCAEGSYYTIGNVVIPDTVEFESVKYPVKSIGNNAFRYCYYIDSVTIPNTVLTINNDAFSNCLSLKSVTIGNTVVSIGERAFISDTSLLSITIPASVSSIGDRAFMECKGLTSIIVNPANAVYDSRENSNAIIRTNDNVLLFGCRNTIIPSGVLCIGAFAFYEQPINNTISIPNSVNSIGDDAFFSCDSLMSIIIPNSVTEIGVECFYNCKNLAIVDLGDSIVTIKEFAFYGCGGLNSIVIPNTVTDLRNNVFNGCTSLSSVVLPDSIGYIGYGLFQNCNNLTSIVIPNSVVVIYSDAFNGCTSLASVILPNNPTRFDCWIYERVFKGCTSLGSIVFPDCFNSIGDNSFQYCTSLTSVTLGSRVSYIGNQAFSYCNAISEIHSRAAVPPELATNAFLGVPTSIPVHVPCTATDYQAATGWNAFSNYQGQPYVLTVTSEGNGTVTVVQPTCEHDTATLTATADEGYIFYRWSDGNTENPRVFRPTSDQVLTAYFGVDTCVVTTLPYTMDFEDYNKFTNCWTIVDRNGDGHSWERVLSYNNANGGLYYLSSESFINGIGAITPDNWFISPAIQIPEGSVPQLRWYARGFDDTDFAEHYSVYVSTTGNSTSDFTTSVYSGNTINEWVEQVVNLSAYVGQTIYIAFRHHACSNKYQLRLDDISIIDLVDYIGEECINRNYPYSMGFESNSSNLNCWYIYDQDGDGNNWTLANIAPHSGSQSIASASYTNRALTPDNWLVSGAFELPSNTPMMLTWYARGSHETDFAEHYSVYVSAEGNVPGAFSTQLFSGNTINAWEKKYVDLSAYAGQIVFIAFRHHGCTDMNYLNLDDVAITQAVNLFTVTVKSANNSMGSAMVGGNSTATVPGGETVTLFATPASGYHFVRWNDNNTDNPRVVTVTGNTTYTAYFEVGNAGIEDANENNVNIHVADGCITVMGAEGKDVSVYDMMGRMTETWIATATRYNTSELESGVYMVKVGDYPAHKVVVVR